MIFPLIHDLFIEKHCDFTHLLKKMAIVIQKREWLFLVSQLMRLRSCRGPWLDSKISVAIKCKYNLLVIVKRNKRQQFVQERKSRQWRPNSHSITSFLSHPIPYSGTKTWNSKTLRHWHPNDFSECYLTTSCNNSRLNTGVRQAAEHDTLRRSAKAKVSCPLGLETSQKGKGQVHYSPRLPISGQWDWQKQVKEAWGRKAGRKCKNGEESNVELKGSHLG